MIKIFIIKNCTKLLLIVSFVLFLWCVFKTAASFYHELYADWAIYFASSWLSYFSYVGFINSSSKNNEEDYY